MKMLNPDRLIQPSAAFSLAISIIVAIALLTGCNPLYVARAAYEQSKILMAREEITAVLNDQSRSPEVQAKLKLVLKARDFAISMGLTPGDSFTKFVEVDKEVLAWVVAASKPDSFTLYTWWFPIVGTVPYKGYFSKEDAEDQARRLERKGFESWVRGTEAMSTLGWFNDPVLSTTLKNEPARIANTVIHESVHSTVWIKNYVDFNESLANFVGGKGMQQLFRAAAGSCVNNCEIAVQQRELACRNFKADLTLATAIDSLYKELDSLYKSSSSKEEKLRLRELIFEQHIQHLREVFPRMTALKKINNAELIQLKLYMTDLMRFENLFRSLNGSWEDFFKAIREIAQKISDNSDLNPWELLASKCTTENPIIDDEVCQ